ncbi:Abortive infection bacteriophage resistance protein [Epilithonimonas bovis DSM 19482]|uniref:Abortive infection bacteriophage resistance protein n=1 Tax=Epilithonimonas bovis DSM 19482 TaxID=1121284 RepID=A0A1U7PWJ2_9FLAO|nr:Abi family protein [Epilithonimonas bovis]SIT97067.1 Abortive infection bacteriophage resistance protein [Epilithonimonas bovis DSM 19482]
MGRIATSITQQIEKLEERGMVLDMPLDKIKEVLLDIGYYRLGFYWHPFEIDNESDDRIHRFQPETKFSTILDLYYLDVDLRHLLIKFINRIEVNYRTKLIYYASNKYKNSPTWFVDPKVITKNFIDDFDKYYNDDFKKTKVIAKHHKKNINDKYAPAWKTLEYFTFGTNLKIYKSFLDSDIKERISEIYNVKDTSKFIKLMETIVFVRNYCAHSGVMFDLRNTYGIPKLPFYEFNNNDRHCLDSCMKIINFILYQISENRSQEMMKSLEQLFLKYADKNAVIKDIIDNKIRFVGSK